ncbi:hypothetical protein BC835DRAFT_964575 [Cytidiella melzeri]|nr:hypothetical protein BC835DRAFT_964575 [Cytidiella melzeri]
MMHSRICRAPDLPPKENALCAAPDQVSFVAGVVIFECSWPPSRRPRCLGIRSRDLLGLFLGYSVATIAMFIIRPHPTTSSSPHHISRMMRSRLCRAPDLPPKENALCAAPDQVRSVAGIVIFECSWPPSRRPRRLGIRSRDLLGLFLGYSVATIAMFIIRPHPTTSSSPHHISRMMRSRLCRAPDLPPKENALCAAPYQVRSVAGVVIFECSWPPSRRPRRLGIRSRDSVSGLFPVALVVLVICVF